MNKKFKIVKLDSYYKYSIYFIVFTTVFATLHYIGKKEYDYFIISVFLTIKLIYEYITDNKK